MSTETITLTLPDGSAKEFPADATPLEVARTIGERLAKAAVAGQLDGAIVDLRAPIGRSGAFRVLTPKDPEAGVVIRHSAEHVLADAVERVFPGTIIDAGRQDHSEKFQYDFRIDHAFTQEDLERIEAEMARIVKEGRPFERRVVGRAAGRARSSRAGRKRSSSSAWRTSPRATRSRCSSTASSWTCAAGRTCSAPTRSARSS